MAARKKKKSSIKNRMIAYTVTISIIFSALAVRIAYIQFVHGEEYSQAVLDQQTKEKEITPRRGTIYDCNGKELAVSASVDTVVIDPIKMLSNHRFCVIISTARTKTARSFPKKKRNSIT